MNKVKMARSLLTICIFCFVCATHSPCASHVALNHSIHQQDFVDHYKKDHPPIEPEPSTTPNAHNASPVPDNLSFKNSSTIVQSDNADSSSNYIQKIFEIYGDGDRMTVDGFKKLLKRLDRVPSELEEIVMTTTTTTTTEANITPRNVPCIDRDDLISALTTSVPNKSINSSFIDNDALREACPALLYSVVASGCGKTSHSHDTSTDAEIVPKPATASFSLTSVWLYSSLAVILISACGVLGIAIIPVMQKWFYQPLLQFLVALAVGTLSGDALLHLLPHAMSSPHSHGHEERHAAHDPSEDENVWRGFVAMSGIVFFFFLERFTLLVAKWRKSRHALKLDRSRVKVIKQNGSDYGNKQCIDKYSSFPLCYNEILDTPTQKSQSANNKFESNLDHPNDLNSSCTEANVMLAKTDAEDVDYTVILREHENRHHGHSHTHGHVHAAPKSMSSVAWMVIMGDGLHNFTDGMAIGAAFSSSIAGGFSTAVAVFCHELPHELGDFAMLLQAGMTMKQAMFYNLLSSVLCIFGNFFGIWLGHTETASRWVFAAAAGMFIYIALVDMIPELSSAHKDESNLMQFCLHLGGLVLGFSIMMVIAIYEHDLKNIFHDQ